MSHLATLPSSYWMRRTQETHPLAIRNAGTWGAHLEKRFNIRPAGVVSKKLIGDLKIA